MHTFSIASTVRSYPRLPYEKIKDDILGKKYGLSLVFVGAARAKKLNETHRRKTYVPNVLSFPVEKNIGELFITPDVAKREASAFGMTYNGYVGYLFIHGLLHLKGLDHGPRMDAAEKRYISKYKLK
jgi:probable rRNA maturation factor